MSQRDDTQVQCAPRDLLLRVARGDQRALEAVYDRYHELVFGIATKTLGNWDAAEDVTHAVFLTVWRHPLACHVGSFDGWLARLTRRRCLNFVRSGQPERTHKKLDVYGGDEGNVIISPDAESVRAALASLPENQRIPIEMGFFGAYTYAAIAKTLSVPKETVTARIRCGLRRMHVYLEQRRANHFTGT